MRRTAPGKKMGTLHEIASESAPERTRNSATTSAGVATLLMKPPPSTREGSTPGRSRGASRP